MKNEAQSELFTVEKSILIKQLEGGIISLMVDGHREIPDDIAAAQHRVGEILGLEAEKKHTRKNMSYEKAVKEARDLLLLVRRGGQVDGGAPAAPGAELLPGRAVEVDAVREREVGAGHQRDGGRGGGVDAGAHRGR